MSYSEWARDLAEHLLAEALPRRWAHVQGVAAQAVSLSDILGDHADLVIAAAWLHDIGYAPAVADTGFHPLDGARYLRDTVDADPRLCRLVAHHTCAMLEAEERGLAQELRREFAPERPELADALTYCDMTTGPDGRRLSVDERIAEIHSRYGKDHLVSRFIARATPHLTGAVHTISSRLSIQPMKGVPCPSR